MNISIKKKKNSCFFHKQKSFFFASITVGDVSGGMYVLITFMYCVCPVVILMDCASTVVSGLMRFCVKSVVPVYLIV